MKLAYSFAIILAAAASQVLAVTPIPVAGCTKQVVVDPKYDSCLDFARDFNVTFAELLTMNDKLRKDCMNLDTGEKMCVSVNPGGLNPPLVLKKKNSKNSKDAKNKPIAAAAVAVPVGTKASDSKIAPAKKAPVVVVAAPLPAAAPAHAPLPAAVVAPVPATTEKKEEKKEGAKNVHSSSAAVSARSSLAVAAAGAFLSLAFLQ